jgi:hypothetical protein
MRSGKRLIGGFSLMMLGFGLVLDTPWFATGIIAAVAGLALVLRGTAARR